MRIPKPSHRAKRLVLHIGAPKTGSTAIQVALTQNRGRLLEQGFLYPNSLGLIAHSLIAICAGSIWRYGNLHKQQNIIPVVGVLQTRKHALSMLADEVDASQPDTIILSYEGLFSQCSDKASVQRLKAIADAFAQETKILVFLRRQDEALISHFVHNRRLGETSELLLPHELRRLDYLDYHKQLCHWEDIFGCHNLSVMPFRRDRFFRGDIVQHFMELLGIKTSGFQFQADMNIGLDGLQEEFLQRLNTIMPRFKHGRPNKLRWGIHQAIDRAKRSEEKRKLSLRDRKYIMEYFKTSNQRLAERYEKSSEAFFPPLEEKQEQANSHCLSVDDAIHIAADMWEWSVEYIFTLNEIIARHEAKIKLLENRGK